MKIKYLSYQDEWLPGDFVPPPSTATTQSHFSVWKKHLNPELPLLAMKVHGAGTGIWSLAGNLMHYFDRGIDLIWLEGGQEQRCVHLSFHRMPVLKSWLFP